MEADTQQQPQPMTAEPRAQHEWLRKLVGDWVYETAAPAAPGEKAETLTGTETVRFVGTWIGSMMHHPWVYDGELDETGKILTLNAVGPDFSVPGSTRQYRDIIEIEDDDNRLLIGRMLDDDGQWQEVMRARYRRA